MYGNLSIIFKTILHELLIENVIILKNLISIPEKNESILLITILINFILK